MKATWLQQRPGKGSSVCVCVCVPGMDPGLPTGGDANRIFLTFFPDKPGEIDLLMNAQSQFSDFKAMGTLTEKEGGERKNQSVSYDMFSNRQAHIKVTIRCPRNEGVSSPRK